MLILWNGCIPIPNAEYGEIVRERSGKEFSVELPSKYHPSLKKKAVFQDRHTSDDEFTLLGLRSTSLKLPSISPRSNSI